MARIIWVTITIICSCYQLNAAVLKVCKNCSYKSFKTAYDFVSASDTILIIGGEYVLDNLFIEKSITILGSQDPVFISKEGDEILTILADYVTVKGIVFKDVTTSYLKERAAIRVQQHKHYLIEDNYIIDCFFGVYLEKAHDGIVNCNRFSGNATTEAESGNGIHAWSSNRLLISNNYVTGHRDGIYFEFVDDSMVESNHSEKNKRYGLHFMFSNDDAYQTNTFSNNGVGVAVMFSSRIDMWKNNFTYNWGRASYGLLLKEINDATIAANNFEENTIGIFVEGSNRVLYRENDFQKNGWAVKFSGGCEDNEITRNNFINNSLDLIINTRLASNQFHHNYWSSYAGYDLNKDQIGDVPHYPVKLFSYILDQAPEAIVLMRSFFVDLVNFSERVSPVFTPKEVMDSFPLMNEIQ